MRFGGTAINTARVFKILPESGDREIGLGAGLTVPRDKDTTRIKWSGPDAA